MKVFQETVLLLLPLLVVGRISDNSEDRDGRIMDTSEKWECYVFGQCQEYSVNFEEIDNAESCHKFCGKNDDCKWWTWEPENSLCSLFANCTDPKQSAGHPDAGPCSDCISGQQACPARECHSQNKCQGHFVNSREVAHLEDCINICKDTVACEWYTYDKKDDHCMLYKNCNSTISCDTCATGKKYCSKGYHGNDEEAVSIEIDVCQQRHKCQGHKAGKPMKVQSVAGCVSWCNDNPSCKFYTLYKGFCAIYEDCNHNKPCETCASGSKADCA